MTRDPLHRNNLDYTEQLYHSFLKDPSQVEESWRWFFQGLNQGLENNVSQKSLEKEFKVFQLLNFYRDHGSLKAKLDPLGNNDNRGFPALKSFGIESADLEKSFAVSHRLFSNNKPLKEVIAFLEKQYCQTLALQVSGCRPEVKQWFFNEFEKQSFTLSPEDHLQAFDQLLYADSFEKFIHFNFLGKKRFSLEGLDALIPILDYLLQKGAGKEMKNLVIGMSHRGRINVLVNILKQNPAVLFSSFRGEVSDSLLEEKHITWDVKYHLGFSSHRKTQTGSCDLYLGYNPSHLEAIGSVICGAARALQRKNQDTQDRKSVVPVLIHGDAAFCGQGVVSETLQLSKLKAYEVGGSLHVILNNQLGFTTLPSEGRSSLFASDLAKSIKAPVLLVNADDIPACLKAMDMAMRFRYQFGMDVFIDLIGYRRYGHNEGDEPLFTQPIMYKKIKEHPRVLDQYKSFLKDKKILDSEQAEEKIEKANGFFDSAFKKSKSAVWTKEDYLGPNYKLKEKKLKKSSIEKESLERLLPLVCEEPESVVLNPKLKKILNRRKQDIQNNCLDWAVCELLAYASLIEEGFSVRLSGQDSARGTFSHRHAAYYDYENNQTHIPLKTFAQSKKREFCLYNSPLSEMAVLGFEYGNSCLAPDFLTLWEAQFGDFVNGAQIIIDQFISAGESKWLQKTDIVLLLPHAYEGQGHEHSSAYLERFLQLCSHDNMRVCQFTKASNLFHALRRQKLTDRKPLVVMTPKSLLRQKKIAGQKEELIQGQFKPVIWDIESAHPREIENVILCSGKVYFELIEALKKDSSKQNRTAVVSLEQLYPFPEVDLNPVLNGFPCLSKIIWFQEEPKNRGAWFFVKDHLERLLKQLGQNIEFYYEGREDMSAPAEGTEQAHRLVQSKIIQSCLLRL